MAVTLALALGGCSTVKPVPIAEPALLIQARADKVAAAQDVVPITGVLTLDQALARALKYNLDRRAKMMEEALALKQVDVSSYDMLPRLLAQVGYSDRNNDMTRRSVDAATGAPSQSQFISQERRHSIGQLGFSWSLLDYSLGYSNTRQQADRFLVAAEKRRKAMHLLMQDVRTAFWRAVSAQKLRGEVQTTIALAEEALSDSRKVEAARIRNPIDSLRYQRQVLENMRLLEAINQELSAAHIELATLINAPLAQTLQIAEPEVRFDKEALAIPVEVLEETAMAENADIREQHYNASIARQETRKVMARLFPNISFNYGVNYDTDNYLINKNWNETGIQISYNLFNLFTGPAQIKLAEAGVSLAEQRRMAVQMAALAQVHLARQQFANTLSQFDRAEAIWQTDRRIAEHVSNREVSLMQTKLDRIGNQTAAILSLLRRYQSMAAAQAAEARLQASLGVEPKIGSVGEISLDELGNQVGGSTVSNMLQGRLAAFRNVEEARAKAEADAKAAVEAKARAAEELARLKAEDEARAAAARAEADEKAAQELKAAQPSANDGVKAASEAQAATGEPAAATESAARPAEERKADAPAVSQQPDAASRPAQ